MGDRTLDLDLTGARHAYRFRVAGPVVVTGARGGRSTVAADVVNVKVNDKGKAFSVIFHGNNRGGYGRVAAIFHEMDLTEDHPEALYAATAAEREFEKIRKVKKVKKRPVPADRGGLADWPDPDARPTY